MHLLVLGRMIYDFGHVGSGLNYLLHLMYMSLAEFVLNHKVFKV